jgi:hypothetical protein
LIQLESDPVAALRFADFAGGVAAGERVEDKVAWIGQEADEEQRDLDGETRRVRLFAIGVAPAEVVAVGVVVAAGDQVRGDGCFCGVNQRYADASPPAIPLNCR